MNIIRRTALAGVLAMAAFSVSAAPGSAPKASKSKFDVTGTWAGTAEGGRGPAQQLVFVLKQDGDKLTGTVATNGGPPVEITEARVLRTSIWFTVSMAMPAMPAMPGGPGRGPGMGPGMGGGRPMVTEYSGSLSGDELKLTSKMQMPARDGDSPAGTGTPKTTIVAKRQQ